MQTINLNGEWTLYYYAPGEAAATPAALAAGLPHVPATVPGNVELDLSRAGLLPEDLFFGTNLLLAEKYEAYGWWYVKEFQLPALASPCMLTLDGVDCFAAYYVNDIPVGTSANALVPVSLDVTNVVREGANTLAVHIKPITEAVQNNAYGTFLSRFSFNLNPESIYIRKPAHCFGWDIMPRAVSAGLWRDVRLEIGRSADFKELHLYTRYIRQGVAALRLCFDTDMPLLPGKVPAVLRVEGRCGAHSFSFEQNVHFKAGQVSIKVKDPMLWWPYGYGDANVYDVVVTLTRAADGAVFTRRFRFGIRTLLLERTQYTTKKNLFRFIVNGVHVMCRGSNWVPLDAYHSRDKERLAEAMALVSDLHCNMLRCWGGNVYECDEFYHECDARGIMVWQDFAMACHIYPQDEAFQNAIAEEAAAVVKRLRNHACIALWSGDNENDIVMAFNEGNPDDNVLTRKVLPEVIKNHDAYRSYLPSSPYLTGEQYESGAYEYIGEDHLWGPRDYFKSIFYMRSNAAFISEIGYHGCPSVESLKKYIDEENLNNINHPQWVLHSADQREDNRRINLLPRQIQQLFGSVPAGLDDFVMASQITQAEAKKFFIEHMRIGKPEKSGILWWNLLDGWPQISDAVVDYYFDKKLAYHYIKNSQAPFAIMVNEIEDWNRAAIASNDTLQAVSGCYSLRDGETGEVLLSGAFEIPPNENRTLGTVPAMYSTHALYLLEWETNLGKGRNHYVCGHPPLDFARYQKWLPLILEA